MSDVILRVENLSKRFGGFTALQNVALHLTAGERLGLIGPNGSGKTTLINCISGALYNDDGTIVFEGADITRLPPHQRARLGIARSFQIPKPFRSMSVLENLRIPLEYAAWSRAEHRRITDEAMHVLETIGLKELAGKSSGDLTQVDMRKLELARALAAKPKVLVSDEAMAGLSGAEVDEIIEILLGLNRTGVAVIMIEHIMRAVMKFSERVAVLDAGQKIADGDPQSVIANPDVQRAYLGE
ncbi:MAG: ABC transporter ATP-binding protein [Burkholderiales bacterium]|nr:ABC transporter ATP-binding protein [Burkholderiales bacterium]